jgi:hypothetical protein
MSLSNQDSRQKGIILYRVILCIFGWTSVFIGITLNIMDGYISNYFNYFSVQSLLIVDIWLTIALIYTNKDEKLKVLESPVRGAVTLYTTVTFLVFAILIQPTYQPQGLYILTSFITHYLIPIGFIFDWFLTETDVQYKYIFGLYWTIYPLIYLIYTLVRGYFTGFYPYTFLDLNSISIIRLIINITFLIGLFLFLGFLYISINRIIYKKKNS